MDYLKTAVGGENHRKGIVDNIPSYNPKRILVHLGTNDVNQLETLEGYTCRINACYQEIAERWPGIRTDVFTPVWRTEFSNGSELGKKRYENACLVRDLMTAACRKYGFVAHDGLLLSPNARALLADHCHLNDYGFAMYFQNKLSLLKGEG